MPLSDLKSLQNYLQDQHFDDIFFAVTFPKDALGLEEIFPIKIVSFDDHPISTQIKAKNDTFSLLSSTKDNPKRRSTSVLLRHPQTKKYINSYHQYQPNILVYKPSPSLFQICKSNNWQLLANPSELNRQFEHKIKFAQILTDLNIPQPLYQIAKCHDINYEYYSQKFGLEFFVQFPRGFAGSTTFLIKSKQDLDQVQAKFLNYPTKISQKIDGPTYSLNACVVNKTVAENNIIIQKPFYQITNILELNPSAGGTCGNIYSDINTTKLDLTAIFADTTKFGQLLDQNNYHGIFGLDFVIDSQTGQHYFIECNPRLTASIPMITKLQIKNNEIPLLALHLMEFLQLDYQLDLSAIQKISKNPTHGSQIIFRNITDTPTATPVYYPSGIYNTEHAFKDIFDLQKLVLEQSNGLQYQRPGKDILDIKKENEFLILCEPKDKIISPAIEYLRVQSLI